jgi:Fe2+ transport system protein B
VDTTVYQNRFENVVKRSFSTTTVLTLPWWNIALKGELGWRWLIFEFIFLLCIGWLMAYAVVQIGGLL